MLAFGRAARGRAAAHLGRVRGSRGAAAGGGLPAGVALCAAAGVASCSCCGVLGRAPFVGVLAHVGRQLGVDWRWLGAAILGGVCGGGGCARACGAGLTSVAAVCWDYALLHCGQMVFFFLVMMRVVYVRMCALCVVILYVGYWGRAVSKPPFSEMSWSL